MNFPFFACPCRVCILLVFFSLFLSFLLVSLCLCTFFIVFFFCICYFFCFSLFCAFFFTFLNVGFFFCTFPGSCYRWSLSLRPRGKSEKSWGKKKGGISLRPRLHQPRQKLSEIWFMCFSLPTRNDPKITHLFATHPVPQLPPKIVYVYVFSFPHSRSAPKGRQQKGETGPGTHIFADFCRFSLILGSLCKSRDLGVADFRRKPQIFAGNRRKPQIFAETGFSHLLSPFWRAPTLFVWNFGNGKKGVTAKGVFRLENPLSAHTP